MYDNMDEDIEKYGLYTSDEFKDYITFEEILKIFEELRVVQDDVYYPIE